MTTTDDLRLDDGQPGDRTGAAARSTAGPECVTTRAAMPWYLGRSLPADRRRRLEAHMDRCARCIRTFIDLREASWTRRAQACPASASSGAVPPSLAQPRRR